VSLRHRLAVDQARACLEAPGSVHDGGEAPGPVLAVARQQADASRVAAHHDSCGSTSETQAAAIDAVATDLKLAPPTSDRR
jgi:hypothetical protein